MFSFFSLGKNRQQTHDDWLSEKEIEAALEFAVQQTDARIKALPRYQKRLRPAVATALRHLNELIGQIPGPFEVNRQTFGSNPQVHALFSSVDQIQQMVSHSDSARRYFEQQQPDTGHCYAMMTMRIEEKRAPGYALVGEMQHEVLQTTLGFGDHQLFKPAASEQAVRKDLRERAFELLVAGALSHLVDHKQQHHSLHAKQHRLRAELRSHQVADGELAFLMQEDAGRAAIIRQLHDELAATEAELSNIKARLGTLDDYLTLLTDYIGEPAGHCGLEPTSVCLTPLKVKLDDPSQGCNMVNFARIRIGEDHRAGVLVQLSRELLIERDTLLRQAHRSL